jgi:CheY-like chemotaxis protein
VGSDDVQVVLDEVVAGVMARLDERAAAAGVALARAVPPGLAWPGDPARVAQVLTSLVGTAIDGAGPATVTVTVSRPGPLRFEVTREPGPPPAPAERRLATCAQLVAAMGGELGAGASLWFTVPPAPAPAPVQPAVQAAAPAPPEAGTPTVLVVDDSEVNREVARRAVRRMGYEVAVVADGAAAVEAVAGGGYALVLMDCQMPGMDGYQATTAIRALEGAGRRTPVVAMTASVMEADRRRCLDAGMDDFVAKPWDYGALEAVIGRWAQPLVTG